MPDQTVEERLQAIVRLLALRHELAVNGGEDLPGMRAARAVAASGFVHRTDHHEQCPDCFGDLPARNGCATCRGRGFLVVRRDRDPYAVNVIQRLAGHTGVQHDATRERDRQIDRLTRQLADRPATMQDELAQAEQRDYQWAETRRRLYRDYDLQPLDKAVEQLRFTVPDVAAGSPLGLRFLEPRMPTPIRAPSVDVAAVNLKVGRGMHAHPDALKARAKVITGLVLRDGMPVQWVAWMAGLSVSQVNAIVRGETAA